MVRREGLDEHLATFRAAAGASRDLRE